MELLSNLVWLAVAIALWGMWLAERRRARAALLPSGIKVQVLALAVMTLILLPVISLSDDLQAAQNPAEVERSCIRNDQHLPLPDVLPPVPAVLALVVGSLLQPSPRTIAFLQPPSLPRIEEIAHIRRLGSRPPPAS